MLKRMVVLLSLAVAANMPAQEKLVESIDVSVANIDVVVTDKAGHPVHGLTRADFQLFENGKPQPLSNFYEVRGDELSATATSATPSAAAPVEAPPAALRNRRFVFFVDDYSLPLAKRAQIIESLRRFIDREIHEGDTASVIAWMRGVHVLAPFTGDKAALQHGVAVLAARLTTATAEREENIIKQQCIMWQQSDRGARAFGGSGRTNCFSQVDQYEAESRAMLRDRVNDLRKVITSMAGVEGKKVLVIAGAELPEQPGLALRHFAQNLFLGPGSAGQAIVNTPSARATLDALARAANANGVTIYAIDAQERGAAPTAEMTTLPDPMEDFLRFADSAASYDLLASVTGGRAVYDTPKFDQAFDAVAQDLTSFYSLGYRPANPENTRDRRIVVKTSDPALHVRTRASYALKTLDEQIGDRVIANLFHAGLKSEWPITVRTGTPQKVGRNFKVPVEVTIPPTVTLLPQGTDLVGGFTVYIAVGGTNGELSDVAKRPQTIRVAATAEKELRAKPFVFTAELMVRPGDNILSVAAVDATTNDAGYAKAPITAR